MNRHPHLRLAKLLPGLAFLLLALPAAAASRAGSDLLALVPEDAASVGMVRFSELRSNPLSSRLFEEMDHVSTDGEAARFLQETGLRPREDVDLMVACITGADSTQPKPLVIFQGRFDSARLTAAALRRGAVRQSVAGGDYLRLPDSDSSRHSGEQGAVAFLDGNVALGGSESAVEKALSDRAAGGTRFASGAGLGRELSRVDPDATAWALVDVEKARRVRAESARGPAAGLVNALQSVSLFAIQANVASDAVELRATGFAASEETRELLEDALRGLTAAWRMAAQEKNPELVSAIRRFRVTRDDESVSITGKLSGDLLRSLVEQSRHRTASR